MLFDHVRGLEQGAGKHELLAEGDALALEQGEIPGLFGLGDGADMAERADQPRHGRPVLGGGIGAEDGIDLSDAKGGQLLLQLVMVYDLMSTHLEAPFTGFGAGSGSNHLHAGELAGELDGDGANSASSADDQQLATALAGEAKAVEQGLPGGDGGQRQCGCLHVAQTGRSDRGDALIHQLQGAVAAGAADVAGIPDPVAGLEQGDFAAGGDHFTDRIPTQHARAVFDLGLGSAHLGVDRIDGGGVDPHQQVPRARRGVGQLGGDKAVGMVTRQIVSQGNGFHGYSFQIGVFGIATHSSLVNYPD